ncbi:MAG TPA: hypothetical protein VHI93_09570, partial [Candidatus Thermoplasmatota archaeon]|nr:hypothetical protein [Candidatus Thermoplasmatota archaeon]
MSFLKLAVPLAALLLVPVATAQVDAPPQVGSPAIFVGTPIGLIKDDNQMVIPYKGNVTIPVAVTLPCSLVVYAQAAAPLDSDHIHVEVADKPSWVVAEELELGPVGAADCAGAEASHTYSGSLPLGVAASAPGVVPQTLNFTAEYAGVPSDTKSLSVSIQFRADYDVVPSIRFPYTMQGGQADFTVSVTSRGNARNMVMVEEVDASTGTFSGLGSVVYESAAPQTFQVSYKAPEGCWTTATV